MTTLADRIRAEADQYGYWHVDQLAVGVRQSLRKRIALRVGCDVRTVTATLKRSPTQGRPRVEADRCPTCGRITDPRSKAS